MPAVLEPVKLTPNYHKKKSSHSPLLLVAINSEHLVKAFLGGGGLLPERAFANSFQVPSLPLPEKICRRILHGIKHAIRLA